MTSFISSSASIEIKKKIELFGVPEFCQYTNPYLKINESDFFLDIKNVAKYRVLKGQQILICPYENSDEKSVNYFLEGPVLGALLHQKGIISFNGSSFDYKGKGIMLCGYSGMGKSSITAAFCQEGASFISDDIAPVTVSGSVATILPAKKQIKLWDDTLQKLKINSTQLQRIRPESNKFYLPLKVNSASEHTLDYLVILSTHNKNEFRAIELEGMNKYNRLRKYIYCGIYLKGMPETEKKFFGQLISLASKVRIFGILRPQICDINEAMRFIENEINS